MTRDIAVALNLVSQATGLVSVLALYVNSIGVPWDRQSWDGRTPFEQRRRRRQIVCACIAIPCALVAVGCQTTLTLLGP